MRSILLVDCGATSCKFSLLQEKNVFSGSLPGYSPIVNPIANFPDFNLKDNPKKIYFFGTAVLEKTANFITTNLSQQFPESEIHVASDSLAAALATCGNSAGYIHILGTGSSINYWDGEKLVFPKINLGYIWEDYASGFDIGKTIISYWSEGKLSLKERLKLEDKVGDLRTFVQNVYIEQPKPFLAKASKLLSLLDSETQKKIINERLELYFTKNIDNFAGQNSHHFIGSMAKLFENEIKSKMAVRSIPLGKIIPDTMNGLISYFQNKIT